MLGGLVGHGAERGSCPRQLEYCQSPLLERRKVTYRVVGREGASEAHCLTEAARELLPVVSGTRPYCES